MARTPEVGMAEVLALPSAEELAGYVHRALCDRDALDPAQAPLFKTPLVKAGKACGVVFHVEGPRRLRASAVWAADAGRVIFYDSTGTRFREVRLSESPAAEEQRRARG